MATIQVRPITALDDVQIAQLGDVLFDCVEAGASVGFMQPFSRMQAQAFFRSVAPAVESGARLLLIAEDSSGVCGTVQLVMHQPDNQPHRADLCKMLVHRRARNRGVAAALLRAVEDLARVAGKSLLVLDTANPTAERLYVRQGWIRVGAIPDYALWPGGGLCDTVLYYRRLTAGSSETHSR